MTSRNPAVPAFVAATLLVGVTLTTFYLLRNYGPESAIQRFHQAALDGDQRTISEVTLQSPNDPRVQRLEALVVGAARRGAHPEVQLVDRTPNVVNVVITYLVPEGDLQDINWVVARTRASRWLINTAETRYRGPMGF